MAGTHYTLDRDKPENQHPMAAYKQKPCGRCGTVKPNTFEYFGKKLWKSRTDLTTTDICIQCQKDKVSASMKARWAARKGEIAGAAEEAVRMARTLEHAQPVVLREPEAPAVVIKPLDESGSEGVKALTLEDAFEYNGTGVAQLDSAPEIEPEPTIPGLPVVVPVETESERLMREFLTGT